MAKYCVMTNAKKGQETRVFYPNTSYERNHSIEMGYFNSYSVSLNGGRIYEKDLFNTHKEAKQFQKNCELDFPETIVQEIDENDPRIVPTPGS